MKEDFLHYVWKYQKLNTLDLKTVQNEAISVIHPGNYLQMSGPDFFNAQLEIDGQKWAGNIEIHVKSSDWYVHHHERDSAYNNVILHVVWEHDTAVFGPDNVEIPVLLLPDFVPRDVLRNYRSLMAQKSWIYCEKQLKEIDSFVLSNWQERLFFERLERKSQSIYELLQATNHDWEAVLFFLLAKNFGLNTNGSVFLQMANSIPFSIIRKESCDVANLEALFFGLTGLLDADNEDGYYNDLKFRYFYLLQKYQLEKTVTAPVQFFKHRPDNFPTIRLSQLANVYHLNQNLFSKIIKLKSVNAIYKVFAVSASWYWQNHYQFDKESPKKPKPLSNSFIELLVINTIVPLQFAYSQSVDESISEDLIALLEGISPEKNAVIDKFKSFGIAVKSAFQTQSLLQLKKEYCDTKSCTKCAIGLELLKNK